ncbi:hypothetical protein KIL84_017411 [Mauremys mutica]|uniref:Uncharacterized protein n=1 Tax=Mauremys mutica TaxID=74926 RepID=A0A9D3X4T0_9SAUR|nr:hypothetical protein KIL84_017411 [Mauremys mutica]
MKFIAGVIAEVSEAWRYTRNESVPILFVCSFVHFVFKLIKQSLPGTESTRTKLKIFTKITVELYTALHLFQKVAFKGFGFFPQTMMLHKIAASLLRNTSNWENHIVQLTRKDSPRSL